MFKGSKGFTCVPSGTHIKLSSITKPTPLQTVSLFELYVVYETTLLESAFERLVGPIMLFSLVSRSTKVKRLRKKSIFGFRLLLSLI